jgi:hypothetical protein
VTKDKSVFDRSKVSQNRHTHDWERIESDFRAGQMTIREIARQHGLTDGAIRKRARRDGWARDLSNKINVRAQRLALEAAVRTAGTQNATTAYQVDEEAIVAGAAQEKANVLVRQQEAIGDFWRTLDSLRAEIAALEGESDLFDRLRDLVAVDLLASQAGDDAEAAGKREARLRAFDRILSLPSRVKLAKDIADLLKIVFDMEGKVWHLGDDPAVNDAPAGLALFYPEVGPGHPAYVDPANPPKEGTMFVTDADGNRIDYH